MKENLDQIEEDNLKDDMQIIFVHETQQMHETSQDKQPVYYGPQHKYETLIDISPKGKYLAIYSESEKGKKFFGWNIEDEGKKNIRVGEYVLVHENDDKDRKGGQDSLVEVYYKKRIRHMCVSDDKILAYLYSYSDGPGVDILEIVDMKNNKEIYLNYQAAVQFCNFNLKGELILWGTYGYNRYHMFSVDQSVCVYSIQSGKAECRKVYKFPKEAMEAEVINISKDDKIWLRLNNDLYEWNIPTAHTTIILKNMHAANTEEINISNDEEYTCVKLKDERIIVYSNKLGCPIALFDLVDSEDPKKTKKKDSKDAEKENLKDVEKEHRRKRDKLIKRLYNFIISHPNLSCSLLSLLDYTYLNELLILGEDSRFNKDSLNLFYNSKPNGHSFVYSNYCIEVEKFKFREELKTNNYVHEHLNFSDLDKDVLRRYQLERGSIIWKVKIEELEKQKISSVTLELGKIKTNTNNLVNSLNISIKDLKEGKSIKPDEVEQMRNFNKILNKLKKRTNDDGADIDIWINEIKELREIFINWKDEIRDLSIGKPVNVKDIIDKLVGKSNKILVEQIKTKLVNYFIEHRFEKRFNEYGKQFMESFINKIQENLIIEENLKEVGYFKIFLNEPKKATEEFLEELKKMQNIGKSIVKYFDQLKDEFDEFTKLVKDIFNYIRNDLNKRNENTNNENTDENLVQKIFDEIVVTKIKESVKKFTKQIMKYPIKKGFSINVELTDFEIDCAMNNGSNGSSTGDKANLAMIKEMENFIEKITDTAEKNNEIDELVNEFIKTIIKLEPKTKDIDEILTNKNKIIVNSFIKEIENIREIKFIEIQEKSANDAYKPLDYIDKMEEESAKKFIKKRVITKINRSKYEFIVNKSKNKYSVGRFFEAAIEVVEVIVDIIKIEDLVNKFIKNYRYDVPKTDTSEINLMDIVEIENSVREFNAWTKNEKDSNERTTKFKNSEYLIKKLVEITKIKELKESQIEQSSSVLIKGINNEIENLENDPKQAEEIINKIEPFEIEKVENLVREFIKEINVHKIAKLMSKFVDWIEKTSIEKDSDEERFKKSLESLIKELKDKDSEVVEKIQKETLNIEHLTDEFIKILDLNSNGNGNKDGDNPNIKLEENQVKLAKDFIENIKTDPKLKEEIINDIANEVNEIVKNFINDIKVVKINEELFRDSMKRIIECEKLDDSKWSELRSEFTRRIDKIKELDPHNNLNKFKIGMDDEYLQIDKDLIRLFCADKDLMGGVKIFVVKLLNDDEVAILTNIGFFIFNLNKYVIMKSDADNCEDRRLISLNYFYSLHKPEKSFNNISQMIGHRKDTVFKRVFYGWISYVKRNDEKFLEYGDTFLMFAIEINDLEIIDSIYKKCLHLFNEDLENNKAFLSIIIKSMPLMNEYNPEYITRFSLDTNMIIDSLDYKIEHFSTSHLYPYSNIEISYWEQLVTLSILLDKILLGIYKIWYLCRRSHRMVLISMWLFIMLSFLTYYVMSYLANVIWILTVILAFVPYKYYHFISGKTNSIFSEKPKPTIVFIIPYIKFVNYPDDDDHYSWRNLCWWKELLIRPKPSPFVTTINREIYKTWSGEALVNFKWNSYGRIYYFVIWIVFTSLIGCFTAAATLTEESISDDIRYKLLITSIILGFIHFSFEFRQLIYDPIEWFFDPWNYFDLGAYLAPVGTSIYWLRHIDDKPYFWIAFSCLLLDIKFLLFFRAFELFGVYFVIILSVLKKISSFLFVLLIILVSFAHAFLILLRPRSTYSLSEPPSEDNDDLNNPWSLTDSYYQSNSSNPIFIQKPGKNTNMFTDYGTSLFSMYLYLMGDPNSLSNWEYKDNPAVALLMVLFSLFVYIYLMNLLIGLLGNAIEKDNNRSSYIMQKAKILSEIELLYLLPNQRRWKTWFPDVIYYHANVDEIRRKIKEQMKNDEWDSDEFSNMKKKLLNKLNISDKSNQEPNEIRNFDESNQELLNEIRIIIDKDYKIDKNKK